MRPPKSFREEIENTIIDWRVIPATDKILELFTKLIDEKIISMECWKAEYQLNDKEFQAILQILKEFKKEIGKITP